MSLLARSRPMDPTDVAWSGVQTGWHLGGLDLPPLHDVRRRLTRLLDADPGLAVLLDLDHGRQRRVRRGERADFERLVLATATGDPPPPDAPPTGTSLGDLPFRLEVGADFVELQVSHVVFDAWSSMHLLSNLLSATPSVRPAWQRASRYRRDVLLARQMARRPATVLAALRRRDMLGAGTFVHDPGPHDAEDVRTATAWTSAGAPDRLRVLRAERCPGVSLAAILLVATRRAVAEHLVAPKEGAEVLFDVRAAVPGAQCLFGNWAMGTYVRGGDEDPVGLTEALRATTRDGLPLLATAASRVRGRMRRYEPWRPMVAAATGEPRLALSYVSRTRLLESLPWQEGREYLAVTVKPNGLDGLTIGVGELRGRFWINLSYHASRWAPAAVERTAVSISEELEHVLADTADIRRSV